MSSRQLGARVGSTEGIRRFSLSSRKPMSNPDFTTEHSSLLGSSESLESLQEPDWLKDAAHTLVASSEGAALDLTGAAKAALQRSEETLELMRKANEKLAAERHAAALAASHRQRRCPTCCWLPAGSTQPGPAPYPLCRASCFRA